jgi:hypothetical protein
MRRVSVNSKGISGWFCPKHADVLLKRIYFGQKMAWFCDRCPKCWKEQWARALTIESVREYIAREVRNRSRGQNKRWARTEELFWANLSSSPSRFLKDDEEGTREEVQKSVNNVVG